MAWGEAKKRNQELTICHCPEPLFLELKHLIGEAHAFLANDVVAGNTNVIEEHFSCVRRPHAEFINLACDLYSYSGKDRE